MTLFSKHKKINFFFHWC